MQRIDESPYPDVFGQYLFLFSLLLELSIFAFVFVFAGTQGLVCATQWALPLSYNPSPE
jgi:hypothetical protein